MIVMTQCAFCKHYLGNEGVDVLCTAFPEGVPDIILHNEFDHKHPYQGDHGVRWEQSEESLQRMGAIDLFTESGRPEPALSKAS